jgi:hypothetical protein
MIRNRTWRSAAFCAVLGADLVVLLVAGSVLPGFVPYALGALVLATLWALRRPSGWGAFALVVVQVLVVAVPGSTPTSILGWAFTAAAAAAVVLTHLALTMLGSWPRRADLPRASAARWVGQAAVLVWAGIAAAGVGALASATPMAWAPWLGAVALGFVAAVIWQVRVATRRS